MRCPASQRKVLLGQRGSLQGCPHRLARWSQWRSSGEPEDVVGEWVPLRARRATCADERSEQACDVPGAGCRPGGMMSPRRVHPHPGLTRAMRAGREGLGVPTTNHGPASLGRVRTDGGDGRYFGPAPERLGASGPWEFLLGAGPSVVRRRRRTAICIEVLRLAETSLGRGQGSRGHSSRQTYDLPGST